MEFNTICANTHTHTNTFSDKLLSHTNAEGSTCGYARHSYTKTMAIIYVIKCRFCKKNKNKKISMICRLIVSTERKKAKKKKNKITPRTKPEANNNFRLLETKNMAEQYSSKHFTKPLWPLSRGTGKKRATIEGVI